LTQHSLDLGSLGQQRRSTQVREVKDLGSGSLISAGHGTSQPAPTDSDLAREGPFHKGFRSFSQPTSTSAASPPPQPRTQHWDQQDAHDDADHGAGDVVDHVGDVAGPADAGNL